MFRLGWLLVLLWVSPSFAADFAKQLAELEKDPKTAVANLSQTVTDQGSAQDWLLLSHGYLSLLNKDGAMSSVNKALELGLPKELEVAALTHKALVYGLLFRDTQSAVDTLQLAEKHVEFLDHPSKPQLQSAIFESFAQAYNQLGQIPKAVVYADSAIQIASEHQLKGEELKARLIAGRLALQQNYFAQAQQHLAEGLRLAEELGQTSSLGSINLRLGMAYHKLEQYPLAISHFDQATQFFQQPGRRNQLITVLLNKAQSLQQNNQPDLAAIELTSAMKYAQEINDPTMIAQAYYGQAELALAQKDWPQAEILLQKAQELYTQLRSKTMATETALAQVQLALDQQQTDKAIAYLPKVEDFDSLPLFLQEAYLLKAAKLNALQQKWQDAFMQLDQAKDIRLQIDNEQQKQFLDALQQNLRANQLEKSLKDSQQQSQTWQLLSLALSVLSMLLLLLWLRAKWLQRRQHKAQTATSWQDFCIHVEKSLKSPAMTQLQVLRAPALNATTSQALLGLIAGKESSSYCFDGKQLWILRQGLEQVASQHIERTLPALATLLPSSWQSLQLNGDDLLGKNAPARAIDGLASLLERAWQLQPDGSAAFQRIEVKCSQNVPCDWLGENIQRDLENAIQLGLLQLLVTSDKAN